MAGSVNKVILIGNLGADPEIRNFENGGTIANLRIATTESWKDRETGEKKSDTTWHSLVIKSSGLAKVAEQYLKKGMQIYVEGRLKTRTYEKNGETKYVTEVVVDELTMLGGAPRSTDSSQAQPADTHAVNEAIAAESDDLPF